MAEITGAQSLIQSLESAGVDTVFGIPGGAIIFSFYRGRILFQENASIVSVALSPLKNPPAFWANGGRRVG